MNQAFLNTLVKEIALPKEALFVAEAVLEREEATFQRMKTQTEAENLKTCLLEIKKNKAEGAAFCLAFCLSFSEESYKAYAKKQLPDAVFFASMRDITVWVKTAKREDGVDGLLEIGWLMQTLYLHLFRIGRLQFQFFKVHYALAGLSFTQRRHAPLPNHSEVLNIHIPEDGKLDFDLCKSSVAQARAFFKAYYPEYHFQGLICDSWLLDPKNAAFMEENSNIRKFSALFSPIFATRHVNREIVKRLWGKNVTKREYKNLSETTSLQRRTKAYLLSGGKTGNGYGFIVP